MSGVVHGGKIGRKPSRATSPIRGFFRSILQGSTLGPSWADAAMRVGGSAGRGNAGTCGGRNTTMNFTPARTPTTVCCTAVVVLVVVFGVVGVINVLLAVTSGVWWPMPIAAVCGAAAITLVRIETHPCPVLDATGPAGSPWPRGRRRSAPFSNDRHRAGGQPMITLLDRPDVGSC